MNNIEGAVAQHYGDADLLGRIVKGLEAARIDLNQLQIDDLAPVDEFHLGGRKSTEYAVEKMPLSEDGHVLDIGCGIGGAARYIAKQTGCRVSGIDLTPEYIQVAQKLTNLTGLEKKMSFEVASALSMPFENDTFDAAITFHVAMNISDRESLYGEIARVMKPGATFCVFDVMKKSDEKPIFPVPWAESAKTSHLTTPDEMRALLDDAGFEISEVDDRTDFALDFLRQRLTPEGEAPPPLGLHVILGASAREKIKNTLRNMEDGRIAPVQMIARRKEK
ncbi:MAG: methyltransferase domain-containing protein [Rhodospirillaceae bacterium]|jgi:MPBQ/MSBQ methyltransferase|nr:methyltransferase domain-containing protein [Rhodospirillaceae bacterium]MBT5752408.1 methyltransferase domain-containing protein [Rhodospirillaceae bacterium]